MDNQGMGPPGLARVRRRRLPRGTAAALVVFALASGTHSPAEASTDVELSLTFDASNLDLQAIDLSNSGTAAMTTSVVSLNGGQVLPVPSRTAEGVAARFPAFDATRSGARAVIRIMNAGSEDVLDPGSRTITWSADFMVDAISVSKTSGSTDNGNNVLQRGLAGSGHQFKLQVDGKDGKRPGCRVETAVGSLLVVVPVTVVSSTWYRASCERDGDILTGTVSRLDNDGNVLQTWSRTATYTGATPLGDLTFNNPTLPTSIGGKLRDDGTARVAGDQFNGVIDNVVIDLAPSGTPAS